MRRITLLACLAGAVLISMIGCQSREKAGSASLPVVAVHKPVEDDVTDYVDYTGQTNARDSVVIQPRVTGFLKEMPFEEGKDVKKDDVLFVIDPRPYELQLKAAEASVAQNEAALAYAKETNEQFKAIAKQTKDAVTLRELNQYRALEEQAIASLNFAKANLLSAKLNLEWCTVKSPIDGRISRYFLTPGNLVNQDVTNLTTVVSQDPMYVSFYLDEPTLLRIKRAINDGRITSSRLFMAPTLIGLRGSPMAYGDLMAGFAAVAGSDAPLLMGLQGEEGFPHRGTVNFVDNQVNTGTGSILVRGTFRNPSPPHGTYLLTPGMFVRVRLPIGQPQRRLLVIDSAITSDQGVKYVYVVGADNKVEPKPVTLGALQENGLRVITGGLNKDDLVIVRGLQQVRPRTEVQTELLDRMPTTLDPVATPISTGKTKKK
jgi:multidrug efflux system membrane fusion protein